MRGGFRPGAGRKKGSQTKLKRDVAVKAAEAGITPLEYMLAIMRNPKVNPARRDEMAKAAAPYMHARLQAIEHTGGKEPIRHDITVTIVDPQR